MIHLLVNRLERTVYCRHSNKLSTCTFVNLTTLTNILPNEARQEHVGRMRHDSHMRHDSQTAVQENLLVLTSD